MNVGHPPLADMLQTIELRCRHELRTALQQMCRNYEAFLADVMMAAREECLAQTKLDERAGEF